RIPPRIRKLLTNIVVSPPVLEVQVPTFCFCPAPQLLTLARTSGFLAGQSQLRPARKPDVRGAPQPPRLVAMNHTETNPSKSSPPLARALGPLMATAIVAGTVIGSGVFKKAQPIADSFLDPDTHEGTVYFGLVAGMWVIGGLFALLGALAYAEVSILYPKAG